MRYEQTGGTGPGPARAVRELFHLRQLVLQLEVLQIARVLQPVVRRHAGPSTPALTV